MGRGKALAGGEKVQSKYTAEGTPPEAVSGKEHPILSSCLVFSRISCRGRRGQIQAIRSQ